MNENKRRFLIKARITPEIFNSDLRWQYRYFLFRNNIQSSVILSNLKGNVKNIFQNTIKIIEEIFKIPNYQYFFSLNKLTLDTYLSSHEWQYKFSCFKGNNERLVLLTLPNVNPDAKLESVLITFDVSANTEFALRNTIDKLGNGWKHTVICGNLNYELLNSLPGDILDKINIIRMNINHFGVREYNNLLIDKEFWNMLTGEKIFIYFEDTLLLKKSSIMKFIKWDFIQSPWESFDNYIIRRDNNYMKMYSFRTKKLMLEIINNVPYTNEPEYMYFINGMKTIKKGNLPNMTDAFNFGSNLFTNDSVSHFGMNKPWMATKQWHKIIQEKLLNNMTILFHKYELKISDPKEKITYSLERKSKTPLKNNLYAHLHCYDIDLFHSIYSSYLPIISKYFNIIVTYSTGTIENIDTVDCSLTVLKIPNRGLDIGAKYCAVAYLNDNKMSYNHILFLHSKSNEKTRKEYFEPLISHLSDDFIKNIDNYDSYFPNIEWEISDNKRIKKVGTVYRESDIERNLIYRNNLLDYLNCNNRKNTFIEGNVYLLSKKVVNKIYDKLVLYNILNRPTDFDLNWVIHYYKLKGNAQEVYHQYKANNLLPRVDNYHSSDAYIEHAYERVILNLCDKPKLLDVTYKYRHTVLLVGLTRIKASISDNLYLMNKYIENNVESENMVLTRIIDISDFNKKIIQQINNREYKECIFCIQPFELHNYIPLLNTLNMRPNVLWVWEFKSLPPIFTTMSRYFNKVYVQSNYCKEIFANQLKNQVEYISLGSKIDEMKDQITSYSIKNDLLNKLLQRVGYRKIIGYCFDLNSSIIRKNPLNLVRAFNRFKMNNNYCLFIKYRLPRSGQFINSIEEHLYNEFLEEVEKNESIILCHEELELMDLYKLYSQFEYYVSTHCGEGFGLTIYDNMVIGNKIISPYYSAEKDYLKRENIIELEYEEKEIPGLKEHPVYGQMSDTSGCYISVDSIYKSLCTLTFEDNEYDSNDFILYFVQTTSNQDFNTGIQFVTRNLSVELDKYKKILLIKYCENINDFKIINDDELNNFTKWGGINHYRNNYSYSNLSYILEKIKHSKCNFVLPELFYIHDFSLYDKIINICVNRHYKSSHIFYDDTLYYEDRIETNFRTEKFNTYIKSISKFDNIIAISSFSRDRYIYHKKKLNLTTKQKVAFIYIGVVGNNIQFNNNDDSSNKYIIISNISNNSRKNSKILIESFKIIHSKYPYLKLVIFGHGWDNSIDHVNNIEYRNFISNEEKNEIYQNGLFSVYPSLLEGYGIPIYESLMKDIPVICHNKHSTLEIFNNISEKCVSAVDCSNVNILSNEMMKFCNKSILDEIKTTIQNVKFKTNTEYGIDFYNNIIDTPTVETFFCNLVFENTDYNKRGVGNFNRQFMNNFDSISHNFDKNKSYNSIIYNHPPPIRNTKNNYETKAYKLLLDIIENSSRKIAVLYDLIPHIFKDHYKPETDYYKYFELLKQNFDIFVCISDSTKQDFHKYLKFDLDKMIVIYPELNMKLLSNNTSFQIDLSKFSINKKYIIAPLGFDFRKNADNTIKAFLNAKINNYQLVLMYNIPNVNKQQLIDKHVIPDFMDRKNDIIFTGHVSDNDYINLIKNADITLFPSLYEGFGYCVMESVYLNTPVITSNISSTDELGKLSPDEILLCDPCNLDDITEKIIYMIKNLNNYSCKDRILYRKCYKQNNSSLINNITQSNNDDYDFKKIKEDKININPILSRSLNFIKNKDKVHIFPIDLSSNLYKKLLNIFDINIQLRITNGGGGSGCVTDSCFLNKFILTTRDLYENAIPSKYNHVIISETSNNKDWLPILTGQDNGGYSSNDINNICKSIITRKNEIKKYNEGVNSELGNRLLNYPKKLMNCLNLNYESKICFVTPYGDDRSGISDFSYTTIRELSNYLRWIDIYTDGSNINMEKQSRNIAFFNIDKIKETKNNYDEIIWVIGNSRFHNKMIHYGKAFGGTFLIHDESLYELYTANKMIPKSLSQIHPFKLREKGTNIDYKYLCFHDIMNAKNKYIVHNANLKNILEREYNIQNINILEYPNFNLSINYKLTMNEINIIKKAMNIDDDTINLFVIGGVSDIKLPNYSFKILDRLNEMNCPSKLYIFYNK